MRLKIYKDRWNSKHIVSYHLGFRAHLDPTIPRLKNTRIAAEAVIFKNRILICGRSTESLVVLCIWIVDCHSSYVMVAGHNCVIYGQNRPAGCATASCFSLLTKLLCGMMIKRAFHRAESYDDKILISDGRGAESDVEIRHSKNKCIEMPPLKSPLRDIF